MNNRLHVILPLIIFLSVLFSYSGIAQDWTLTVTGKIDSPIDLTPKDFASLPHLKVSGTDHNGNRNEYDGVPLYTILQKAGVPSGDSLHGKKMLLYLQAEALDGYKVVYALQEVDTAFTDNTIIVADKKNNELLDSKEGPLQIIVPKEKKHSRWIRQLRTLRILNSMN